jgi:hypothetical protein
MSMARKIRCAVERITDHGDRVYTVELTPETPVPAFRPGQFLHLALDAYDPSGFWPESRVFSIASAPSQRRALRIAYSVKGAYTIRMEQELRAGGERRSHRRRHGDYGVPDFCFRPGSGGSRTGCAALRSSQACPVAGRGGVCRESPGAAELQGVSFRGGTVRRIRPGGGFAGTHPARCARRLPFGRNRRIFPCGTSRYD